MTPNCVIPESLLLVKVMPLTVEPVAVASVLMRRPFTLFNGIKSDSVSFGARKMSRKEDERNEHDVEEPYLFVTVFPEIVTSGTVTPLEMDPCIGIFRPCRRKESRIGGSRTIEIP